MGDPNRKPKPYRPPVFRQYDSEKEKSSNTKQRNMYPPLDQQTNVGYSGYAETFLEPTSPDWRKSTRSIKAKLAYALTHETCQDVTFIVGVEKEIIRAHKFMLHLTSSSFDQLCSNTDNIKGISIPDVDVSAFKSVLKFIYTDKFEIASENAMHCLYIAKKFDIPSLAERCVELLRASISERNVVTIFQRAQELNENELSNIALGFLMKNARKVINSEDFNELTHENLCYLLERDELNVEELNLFQATLRWAEIKCQQDDLDGTSEDLRYQLKRALSLIRFPLLTSEEFTIHVAPREILTMPEMLELYKYFSVNPANRSAFSQLQFSTKKRSTGPKVPIYSLLRLQDIGAGPWGCNGKFWQLRFMVDRPVSIRGFGLYGSFDDKSPKYNVEIYLECKTFHTKVHSSEVVQLHQKGGIFTVNFTEMVPIQANVWYDAGFTFKGPNTCWGARQLSEVSICCGDKGTVTFRFEDGQTGGHSGGYNNAAYQLPQILFSL